MTDHAENMIAFAFVAGVSLLTGLAFGWFVWGL
jgi:hypothetical protein